MNQLKRKYTAICLKGLGLGRFDSVLRSQSSSRLQAHLTSAPVSDLEKTNFQRLARCLLPLFVILDVLVLGAADSKTFAVPFFFSLYVNVLPPAA
mmetsp:Transcript_4228/g.12429  ORF Transcript_4228/g.12429 Transcript_4228/m.12429 type:complete len:95 (+) Transcript_4228:409-693(+)